MVKRSTGCANQPLARGGAMFVVLLKFSANKTQAGQFMSAHKAWIQRGFDEDVFLLIGNLQPGLGGSIVAHNISLAELKARVSEDPFVAQDIMRPAIIEIALSSAAPRPAFILSV